MARLTVDQLRRSKNGHGQADYVALLESLGYVFVRKTRHGLRYRHPELAAHPDPVVRRDHSWILIPSGRDLPGYVAQDVLESVTLLEHYRREKEADDAADR